VTATTFARWPRRLAALLIVASLAACARNSEPRVEAVPEAAADESRLPAPSIDPLPRVAGVDEPPQPGVESRTAEDRAGLDVLHYDLQIDLRRLDDTVMTAIATIEVVPSLERPYIDLDFVGLRVDSVRMDGFRVPFAQGPEILRIRPAVEFDELVTLEVFYDGRPRDGLFIGPDTGGDLSAFADNWPNRARWWFPANDTPRDKATADFYVRVPEGYSVVANGRFVGVEDDAWHWSTDVEIPAYTMVIGVAKFERAEIGDGACGNAPAAGDSGCVPVSIWALAGSGAYGEQRFSRAADMVDYYTEVFGPYPYEKLAHVQSSTRFGGMENSSAIFYAMGGWAEERMGEGVIAHETVHQWFGDSVTPSEWSHLWVSEGFATYFAAVYFQARDGDDALKAAMARGRQAIIGSDASNRPVVDERSDLFGLLNTNSYPKGGWILHMLRVKIGEEAFWNGIRSYYAEHENSVADTEDVRRVMEEASGQDLESFFQQWAYSPGFPKLAVSTRTDGDETVVTIDQVQSPDWPTFTDVRLDLDVEWSSGAVESHSLGLSSRSDELRIPTRGELAGITLDPTVILLMEEVEAETAP
jgi:aminopeptidase N